MAEKKVAKKKQSLSVPLEIIAEMFAAIYAGKNIIDEFQPNIFGLYELISRFHVIGKDGELIKKYWEAQDKALGRAINDAALLAAVSGYLSSHTVERKIGLGYACIRYIYFDLNHSTGFSIHPPKKNPDKRDNDQIMNIIWDSLLHNPIVQEEIEKQRKAGRLTEWKHEQRSLAIQTYNKLKNRLPKKVIEIHDKLSESLLNSNEPMNVVKP